MANETPPDRGDADSAASGGSTSRAIARHDLEQIIRRAAELTLSDTDTDENISEAEVLRIASELGLPAHHVRRALFELPELDVRPRWYDGWFGPAILSLDRVVPLRREPALRRLEDYLVTREYLQIVRRRGDNISFVPADDAISNVARAFARPGSRHTIARASRVMVGVHDAAEDRTHVHVDVDLSAARTSALMGGVFGGGTVGLAIGAGAAIFAAVAMPGLTESFGVLPHIIAVGGATAGSIAAGTKIAASTFRDRMHKAKVELASLLDRLEHGDRLDPPPAPWRRSLQKRLFGDK